LRLLGIALVLLGPSFTLRAGGAEPTQAPATVIAGLDPANHLLAKEMDPRVKPAGDHQNESKRSKSAVGADVIRVAPAIDVADELAVAGHPAFRPSYAEGYLWALLSATGYGLSPILVRIGLEGKGLGASIAGNLVASVAGTVVMGLCLLWPGRLRHALAVGRESAKWFTLSGILVCISQIFLYMAMSIAPVTVVSPINRLSILFRLYFSRLLNPQHEVFGGRVVLGTIVSLGGALMLSLSIDQVQAALPVPESVLSVLRWHWP
jgi:uncharacterized membrane protein